MSPLSISKVSVFVLCLTIYLLARTSSVDFKAMQTKHTSILNFLFSVLHLCRILMIYNVKSHYSPLGLKPFVDSRRATVYPVTNILLQSLLANT